MADHPAALATEPPVAPQNPLIDAVARERVGQIALVLFFLLFARAQWSNFQHTGRVTGLIYMTLMLLVMTMTVLRRPAGDLTGSWMARVVAALGTYASLLFRPGGDPLVTDPVTAAFSFVGAMTAIVGVLSLNRSFGVVAANRGVVERGLYRVMRHPLYAGYIVSHVGFFLSAPTMWNFALWMLADGSQLARIHYEEQLLSRDPQYVRYRERVRWRLFPGVF